MLDPAGAPISTEDVEKQPEVSFHASGSSPNHHITGCSTDGQIVQNSLVPIITFIIIFENRSSAVADNGSVVDL